MNEPQEISGNDQGSPSSRNEAPQERLQTLGNLPPEQTRANDAVTKEEQRIISEAAKLESRDTPVPKELQDFANMRGRPVVFFLIKAELNLGHAVRLWREFDKRPLESKPLPEVDIVIDSVGGDVHTAYQVVQLLRRRARRYHACVLLYAKSAATLISIGADSITLHELAQLGPLDTQRRVSEPKKREGPEYVSALNDFKGLEELRQFVAQTLDMATGVILRQSQQGMEEVVVKHAIDVVKVTSEPLFSRIDADRLGTSRRMLTIGIEYGRRVLQRASAGKSGGNWQPSTTCQTLEQLAHRLVYEYPSHDHIIDESELQAIGFRRASLFAPKNEAERAIIGDLFRFIAILDDRETIIRLVDPVRTDSEDETTTEQAATPDRVLNANGEKQIVR
jgi:hypothetical protein